ncbi:MAG TPA: hypothetical protein VF796_14180 [Humisphaera sp.]
MTLFESVIGRHKVVTVAGRDFSGPVPQYTLRSTDDEPTADLGEVVVSRERLTWPGGGVTIGSVRESGSDCWILPEPKPDNLQIGIGRGGPYRPGRRCLFVRTADAQADYFFDVPDATPPAEEPDLVFGAPPNE